MRALSKHSNIHVYNEVFDPKKSIMVRGRSFARGMDGGAFCREAIFGVPTEGDKHTIGFKVFVGHARDSAEEYNLWRYLTGDRSVRVCILFRENLFDAFVSLQRSRQSRVWHVKQHQEAPEDHLKPIHIGRNECMTFMDRTMADLQWARKQFGNHHNLVVRYNELLDDFQGTLNKIFDFVEEPQENIPMTFQKLNTIPHSEGVTNYDEVVRFFEFSIYRDFFEEFRLK